MHMLLEFDEKNYSDTTRTFERFAVRGVVCRDGKYAMQQDKYGMYKILGGGIDKGETHEDAVIREVQEELGVTTKITRPLWLKQAFFTGDVDYLNYHKL